MSTGAKINKHSRVVTIPGVVGSGGSGATGATGPIGPAPGGTGIVDVTAGVPGVIAGLIAGNVVTDNGSGVQFSTKPFARALLADRFPLAYPNIFIDPVSGNNANPGTNASPIKDLSFLNAQLFMTKLSADTTITWKSDDPGTTALDWSSIDRAGHNLTFVGTPQVLHTGGTINAGTVAINELTPGGGQRQLVHTSDLATFAPFIPTVSGGASAFPCLINDATTTSSAWLVSGVATASATQPVTPSQTRGALTIGNTYTITRGSNLLLADQSNSVDTIGGSIVALKNFTFLTGSIGPDINPSFQYLVFQTLFMNCSFLSTCQTQGQFFNCVFMEGASGDNFFVISGQYIPNSGIGGINNLTIGGNCYVSQPDANHTFDILPGGVTTLFIVSAFIPQTDGLQIQDSVGHGMIIRQGVGISCEELIWGNGNAHLGILIHPGATPTLGGEGATPLPSVTGADGDFGFAPSGGGAPITVARAWDDATGAYTEAGGPATRTTTWVHLAAAIGAGGFALSAHCVQTGAMLSASA